MKNFFCPRCKFPHYRPQEEAAAPFVCTECNCRFNVEFSASGEPSVTLIADPGVLSDPPIDGNAGTEDTPWYLLIDAPGGATDSPSEPQPAELKVSSTPEPAPADEKAVTQEDPTAWLQAYLPPTIETLDPPTEPQPIPKDEPVRPLSEEPKPKQKSSSSKIPIDSNVHELPSERPLRRSRDESTERSRRERSWREEEPVNGKKSLLIGGAVLALIAGGIGIFFAVKPKKTPNNPTREIVESEPKDREPKEKKDGAATEKVDAKEPPKRVFASPSRQEMKPDEIAEKLTLSTVLITTPDGLGSGVLVHQDPNIVLTNHHVVGDPPDRKVTVYFPEYSGKNKLITTLEYYRNKKDLLGHVGKIIGSNPDKDIAIVELEKIPQTAVAIPLSAVSAKKLEKVFGIGHSGVDFGSLWQPHSGECRQIIDMPMREAGGGTHRVLLTQSAVNPGDSGGPVVNNKLELVGIVSAKARKRLKPIIEKGKLQDVTVDGLDNFSLVIDVEELRIDLEDIFRLAYKRPFHSAPGGIGGVSEEEAIAQQFSAAELVDFVESGTPLQAREAAQKLSFRGKEAVPLLIKSLQNQAIRGRWPLVLYALERIGESAAPAVDAAILCLKDSHNKTKAAAARFLGAIAPHGKKALPELWLAVGNNDLEVRKAAKMAIEEYPYKKEELDELRKMAKSKVVQPAVKAHVIEMMCQMRDISPAELSNEIEKLKLFEDPDLRLRYFIATVMCEYSARFARFDKFKCALPLLGDDEPDVREKAQKLLDIETWESSKQFFLMVEDKSKLLTDYHGKPVLLPQGFNYKNEWEINYFLEPVQVRTSIKQQEPLIYNIDIVDVKLSKVRNVNKEDLDFLLGLIQGSNTPAKAVEFVMELYAYKGPTAQLDLAKIKPFLSENRADDPTKTTNLEVIKKTLMAVFSQKKNADTILNELLKLSEHSQFSIRRLALMCLAFPRQDDPRILKALFAGLEDSNDEVRLGAIDGLDDCLRSRERRFTSTEDISFAAERLTQATQTVTRIYAAKILVEAGAKAADAMQALTKALDDKDILVRMQVVKALATIKNVPSEGVIRLGELVLHDLDKDNIKFTTDEVKLIQVNPGEWRAQKFEELKKSKKELSADMQRLLDNRILRILAIDALVAQGPNAHEAMPCLRQLVATSVDHTFLLPALKAVRNSGKYPGTDFADILVDCLNLFKEELTQGRAVDDAADSILEANNKKRSPLSNAIIETVREMDVKALPKLSAYLGSKVTRVNLNTDVIPVFGAIECLVAVLSRPEIQVETQIANQLRTTLAAYDTKLTAMLKKLPKNAPLRDVELMDKARARVREAKLLLLQLDKNKR